MVDGFYSELDTLNFSATDVQRRLPIEASRLQMLIKRHFPHSDAAKNPGRGSQRSYTPRMIVWIGLTNDLMSLGLSMSSAAHLSLFAFHYIDDIYRELGSGDDARVRQVVRLVATYSASSVSGELGSFVLTDQGNLEFGQPHLVVPFGRFLLGLASKFVERTPFLDLLTPTAARWPKKGDRLLLPAKNWEKGASFPDNELARHVYIWDGYMSAGQLLVDMSVGSRPDRQVLIYPILYNYRHGLELAMKWVIERYGRYANVEIEPNRDHDLWKLWRMCRAIIEDVGGPTEEEVPALDAVELLVKDFHELDRSSLAFRYHSDKNGMVISLPEGVVDVDNIRDVMNGVSNFFNGVDGQLDANSSAAPW